MLAGKELLQWAQEHVDKAYNEKYGLMLPTSPRNRTRAEPVEPYAEQHTPITRRKAKRLHTRCAHSPAARARP